MKTKCGAFAAAMLPMAGSGASCLVRPCESRAIVPLLLCVIRFPSAKSCEDSLVIMALYGAPNTGVREIFSPIPAPTAPPVRKNTSPFSCATAHDAVAAPSIRTTANLILMVDPFSFRIEPVAGGVVPPSRPLQCIGPQQNSLPPAPRPAGTSPPRESQSGLPVPPPPSSHSDLASFEGHSPAPSRVPGIMCPWQYDLPPVAAPRGGPPWKARVHFQPLSPSKMATNPSPEPPSCSVVASAMELAPTDIETSLPAQSPPLPPRKSVPRDLPCAPLSFAPKPRSSLRTRHSFCPRPPPNSGIPRTRQHVVPFPMLRPPASRGPARPPVFPYSHTLHCSANFLIARSTVSPTVDVEIPITSPISR